MKTTCIRANSWILLGVGCILTVCMSAQAAAPYVVLPSGKKVAGRGIKADAAGQILLQTDSGVMTFPKGTKVVIDQPVDYTKALQLLQQRQYGGAIGTLKGVVEKYRYLAWDVKAMRLLAAAYLRHNDFADSVKTYEELFKLDEGMANEPDVREGYLEALIANKNFDKVRPVLDQTIAQSPRKVAAKAQIMRGNAKLSEGDVKGALMDFMRTAEFFKDEKELQPEAYFKTGECLERLNDPRAAHYFEHVVKEFPDSEYAAKAGTKKMPEKKPEE